MTLADEFAEAEALLERRLGVRELHEARLEELEFRRAEDERAELGVAQAVLSARLASRVQR